MVSAARTPAPTPAPDRPRPKDRVAGAHPDAHDSLFDELAGASRVAKAFQDVAAASAQLQSESASPVDKIHAIEFLASANSQEAKVALFEALLPHAFQRPNGTPGKPNDEAANIIAQHAAQKLLSLVPDEIIALTLKTETDPKILRSCVSALAYDSTDPPRSIKTLCSLLDRPVNELTAKVVAAIGTQFKQQKPDASRAPYLKAMECVVRYLARSGEKPETSAELALYLARTYRFPEIEAAEFAIFQSSRDANRRALAARLLDGSTHPEAAQTLAHAFSDPRQPLGVRLAIAQAENVTRHLAASAATVIGNQRNISWWEAAARLLTKSGRTPESAAAFRKAAADPFQRCSILNWIDDNLTSQDFAQDPTVARSLVHPSRVDSVILGFREIVFQFTSSPYNSAINLRHRIALDIMNGISDPHTHVETLEPLLGSKDVAIRTRAAVLLGPNHPSARRVLIASLGLSSDERTGSEDAQGSALEALATVPGDDISEALYNLISRKDLDVDFFRLGKNIRLRLETVGDERIASFVTDVLLQPDHHPQYFVPNFAITVASSEQVRRKYEGINLGLLLLARDSKSSFMFEAKRALGSPGSPS